MDFRSPPVLPPTIQCSLESVVAMTGGPSVLATRRRNQRTPSISITTVDYELHSRPFLLSTLSIGSLWARRENLETFPVPMRFHSQRPSELQARGGVLRAADRYFQAFTIGVAKAVDTFSW